MRVKLNTIQVGVPNCWFSIGLSNATIQDVIDALREEFDLAEIQLEIDGFLLLENGPTFELIRENDLIYVSLKSRKRIKTDHVALELAKNAVKITGSNIDLEGKDPAKISKQELPSEPLPESSKLEDLELATCDSSDASSDSSSDSSSVVASPSKKVADDGSSSSDSSSGIDDIPIIEAQTTELTVPPVMTSYMNPPLSLIGKNKRKLVPKMMNQERVHVHFDSRLEQTEEKEVEKSDIVDESTNPNVVYSTIRLYDDPVVNTLSASQKRRNRRKKAQVFKAIESFQNQVENQETSMVSSLKNTLISNEPVPSADSISKLNIGMKMSYQILEISESYQPQISKSKEAIILAIDVQTNMITLKQISKDIDGGNHGEVLVQNRKFELPPDDEYAPSQAQNEVFIISYNDLISPKLLE